MTKFIINIYVDKRCLLSSASSKSKQNTFTYPISLRQLPSYKRQKLWSKEAKCELRNTEIGLNKPSIQGAKLRKIIGGFRFGNPPLKFGFPKLSQAFRRETENLLESLALRFTGCSVGNPCKKLGFWQRFWVSRTPGNSVISLPAIGMALTIKYNTLHSATTKDYNSILMLIYINVTPKRNQATTFLLTWKRERF